MESGAPERGIGEAMMQLGLLLYQIAAIPAGIIAVVFLVIFRGSEARERLGGGAGVTGRGRIWIHAASLGEFEAARPLITAWSPGGDGSRILLSCTNAIARKRFLERVPSGARVRLAPLDLWPIVARALARERPSHLIFLETEIWPAWIFAAAARGIPIAIVSARISTRSLGRYRALRLFLRPFLERIHVFGCRTEEDRSRWIAIGAPSERCEVWGNTKYDAGPAPGPRTGRADAPFILVAGSIRLGEERVLDAFLRLREGRHDVRLLLAPRHMREVPGWETECLRRGLASRRLTIAGIDPSGGSGESLESALRSGADGVPPVLIVDRIGVLTRLYRVADAAFVGGTWIPLGGHNLFEPAREGIPVFFGSSIEGVRDVAEALLASGGGMTVVDPEALAGALARLLGDPDARLRMGEAARRTAESLSGARGRTLEGLRAAGFSGVGSGAWGGA